MFGANIWLPVKYASVSMMRITCCALGSNSWNVYILRVHGLFIPSMGVVCKALAQWHWFMNPLFRYKIYSLMKLKGLYGGRHRVVYL